MNKVKIIAIVGTSIDLTDNEERDIRQTIALILKRYDPKLDIIISGGAEGVDSMAIEIAKGFGFKTDTEPYKPKTQEWKSYKERNLKIARDCDELYCLTVPVHTKKCYHHKPLQKHQKTAGCWTLKKAAEMNKRCELMVVPVR